MIGHAVPLDDLPSWVLGQAAARSHRVIQQHMGRGGFTGYEYRLLAALSDGDPVNQTELGRRAALDRSDVTGGVRALHERGLVTRESDPEHGRRVIVGITASGARAWTRLTTVMAEVQSEVFAPLTPAEVRELQALLTRITV